MLACALAVLLPGGGDVVQAQTATALVGNLSQEHVLILNSAYWDMAQQFRTGSDEDGYTLSSVQLRLTVQSVSDFPTVKLFSGSANGTEVATLTAPTSAVTNIVTNYTYTGPAGTRLANDTDYWVLVEGGEPWVAAVDVGEDGTPAAGWSIADQRERRAHDSTGAFSILSASAWAIRVNGTIGPPILVSNRGQGNDSISPITRDHSQAFTTGGSNANSYLVDGVTMVSEDSEGDDIALQICGADSSGNPTTTCTDLTAPSSFAAGPLYFATPNGTPLVLSGGTNYAVVFKTPEGDTLDLDSTASNGEDASSLTGWSIRNRSKWKSGATTWQENGDDVAIRIAIHGIAYLPPTAVDSEVTTLEDTPYTFTAADFNFSATTPGDTLTGVQILRLLYAGTFTLAGSAVTANQVVTKTQLDAGSLVYTPPPDEFLGFSRPYTSFTFKVAGSLGTSTLGYMMDIFVTPVNDPTTGKLVLHGPAHVGQRLWVYSFDLEDPDDGLNFTRSYQWIRVDPDGTSNATNIGEDSFRYRLTEDDLGKRIKVRVDLTDSFGNPESVTSDAFPSSGTVSAPPSLVNNTAQGGDSSASLTSDHGQSFTTGYNLTGYTVSSVIINSEDEENVNSFLPKDIALQICAVASDGSPTTTCTDLTAPGYLGVVSLVFTAPTSPALTLSARTTYMVVFKSPVADEVVVAATTSGDEDSTSIPGWEIRDVFQWNNAGTWQDGSGSKALRIAIFGTVNPSSTTTAPTAMDGTVTTAEDTAYTFTTADFNFSPMTPGDTLASVQILTLPALGTLTLAGMPVTANQSVTKTQLDDGSLVYTPPAEDAGSGYAGFLFRVSGSTEASTNSYFMTIDVTAVNDPATGTPDISGVAKVGLVLTANTTAIRDTDGLGSFTYQWIRVDADGTSNATDVGENSNRYLLAEADFSKRIKVRVDFTDGQGFAESPTSDAYPSNGSVQRIEPVLVPWTWAGAPLNASSEPVFGPDEQYRLLVLTNGNLIDDVSTDPDNRGDGAFYNGKVAEGVGANTILAAHKDGFTALVSTTGNTIARDNTETTGTGVPIYWFKGGEVADGYADFYDDSWDTNAPRDQDGVLLTGNARCAWTGSVSSGTPSHRPLGSGGFITYGCANISGSEIDSDVASGGGGVTGIYALSPVFQVIPPLQVTVSFGQAAYTVAEGFSQSVTVTLSADPERTVTIPIAAMDQGASAGDYSVVPTSVTFASGETEKTVTFTAVQDMEGDDGERVLLVFGTLPFAVSAGTTAETTVSIIDNTPGMSVTPRALDVDEGGTAMYTVTLNTVPTGNVTVAVTSNDQGAATVSPAMLTFTPTDWNTVKTVTVTGVEDSDQDNEIVALRNDPSGADYDIVRAVNVTLNVADNNSTDVSVSMTALTVTEEDTTGNSYTVALNSEPTANVTVTVAGHAGTDVTPSPTTLTFTSQNWATAKTVTVKAGNDADTANDFVTLTHSATSTDSDYDGITISGVAVTVTDNDSTGVGVSKTTLTVTEEDTTGNSYTVVLDAQPTANVTVTVAGHAGTDVTPSPTTLTFTSQNWATAQTVTVTAANDADTANDFVTLTHSATSTDTEYDAIAIADVAVTVTDNDSTGVRVSKTTLTVTEEDTTGNSYTVVLDAQPTANVTVTVAGHAGTDVTPNPTTLTFTTSNWNMARR